MKLTRTVQIPTTVIDTSKLKQGELYVITNSLDDNYTVAGLSEYNDFELKFDNGLTIVADDLQNGDYNLSPVETYLDRWVALYEGGERVASSFFVAYDEEDALEVAIDLARTNPNIINTSPILLLNLSGYMDQFGYMPHGAVQMISRKTVKGYGLNVSEHRN